MTRYTKDAHGMYHIHGKKYEMLVGSRAQVVHGTAYKTTGGLKKDSLLQNKNGRIVSKSKHNSAKKEKRLVKAGYVTKKGKFGFVKLGKTKSKRGGTTGSVHHMKMSSHHANANSHHGSMLKHHRGGSYALSPSNYNGKGVGTSGNSVQFLAGNAN